MTMQVLECDLERLIGDYGGDQQGPTILVMGGIHGNEPEGVEALQQVFEDLYQRKPEVRGRLLGMAGNLKALRRGARYIDTDLNRLWLRNGRVEIPHHAEAEEYEAIRQMMLDILRTAPKPVFLIDCHSFSAEGPPFVICDDPLTGRDFVSGIPFPVVSGLASQIQGTLSQFFLERGHRAVAIEGGRRGDPATVANLAFFLWLILLKTGFLASEDQPTGMDASWDRIALITNGLPSLVHVEYRHSIEPEDGFLMNPGFRNFDLVREGQILARDRYGLVHAPMDGCILMPLYQGQGTDGFFLGRGETIR